MEVIGIKIIDKAHNYLTATQKKYMIMMLNQNIMEADVNRSSIRIYKDKGGIYRVVTGKAGENLYYREIYDEKCYYEGTAFKPIYKRKEREQPSLF